MVDDQDHKQVIRERLEQYVRNKPFHFNPDGSVVENVIKAMTMRWEKFGEDYCPCRRVTGDRDADAAIICPCDYHEREVEEEGHCHCHLFTKP